MKSKGMVLLLAGLLVLGLVSASWAGKPDAPGPPSKPPCGTTGPLQVSSPSPSSTSYVQGTSATASASFTVTSPPVQTTGNCDSSSPVFGNGNSSDDCDEDSNVANDITFEVSVSGVTPGIGITLTEEQKTALKNAFSFDFKYYCLTNPGSGSETVNLNFDNADVKNLPVGSYDVSIDVKPETGVGVGAATVTFTVEITQPTAVDTQPPVVQIVSPASAPKFLLNQPIPVAFTATDPPENGAGTGVGAVRAFISACSGNFNVDLTSQLAVTPSLPVAADDTVTATANIPATWIGAFTLTAEADDRAGHTGTAAASFSVGVNVAPLPPIAVPGRQFRVGSTVPIKWQITDYNGAFLPPFENIKITISGPDGDTYRFAKSSDEGVPSNIFIRWELDDSGNATQYITNYQIPATGTYTVKVFVPSACGGESYVEQGSFTFTASTKGQKY